MLQFSVQESLDLAIRNHQAGRLQPAEQLYRLVLAEQPENVVALHLLGVMAHQVGQHTAAVDLIRRAIALQPDFPEAYSNLSNALLQLGQHDAAIAACRQAIALNARYSDAYYNLGNVLRETRQLDAAIEAYRQAVALNANFPLACNNLAFLLKVTGQIDAAVAAYRQAASLDSGRAWMHSNLIFALHFHPLSTAESLAEEHRRWNLRYAAPLMQLIGPHANERRAERPLRIGYVSPDLWEHAVGRFLLPLFAHHDKRQFEILAYAQAPSSDALTERLRSHVHGWRNIVGLSDADTADLIRQDQVDILVDLAMHTAHNRLLVFARKPAPVQVSYLAYCSSTGLETIDYRLSDSYLDPPGTDESVYSEQTVRLPETYWCYEPIVDLPMTPLPALKSGYITFGSLNNFSKNSLPTLTTWARILCAVPQSQLLLHAQEGSHRQRTAELFQRLGVDPQRLRFVGKLPMAEYMQLYQQIDIALDPFPYGGGTTTCDAVWMGVPVVTLAGHTAVGRGGVSILSNVGLPEWIARSEDDYVRVAGALTQDIPRLSHLRSTLRRRMEQSPLMDAPRFARNVESAYRQMWRQWCTTSP